MNDNFISDLPSTSFVSSDNQEEQEEERTDNDHISTEPEDAEEDAEEVPEGPADLNIDEDAPPFRIILKKPFQSEEEAVSFNCSSYRCLTVDTLSKPSAPTIMSERQIIEGDVKFTDLIPDTQERIQDFFEGIGVDDQLAEFVREYSIRAKSQRKVEILTDLQKLLSQPHAKTHEPKFDKHDKQRTSKP